MKKLLNTLPSPTDGKKGWPWTEETPAINIGNDVKHPKISIVTPSFNQGDYIEETIRSVLLQNYPNLEYIIIDGGSTDNTIEILKKYDKHITYWVSEKDRGQSHAINKGIKKCTGEIFNWLNSDDYYTKGALFEISNTFLKENKKIVAAKSNIFSKITSIVSSTPVGNDFFMFSKARIDQPSTFWNFESFKEFGIINESQHLTMDAEHWFKFLLLNDQYNISKLDNIVVNFREHNDSKTVNNRCEIIFERIKLYNQILGAFNGTENDFAQYVSICSAGRKNEIMRGIKDFKYFWLKKMIFRKPFSTIKAL